MTPRIVAELAHHARNHRWMMRAIATLTAALLLIDVWDRAWLWAVWHAVVLSTCISVARDVSRTLERLK